MEETADTKNPVLVTTEHRGVFFGYLVSEPSKEQVTLRQARNCSFWSRSMRGFLGLAESGPNHECRVGSPAEELTLYGITSIAKVSNQAVQAWESAPWG